MATQAQITINAVAGSNTDLPLGTLVQLNNNGLGDETTYTWSILSQPAGPADVLSATNIQAPTFTPTKEGSYLIRLIVNIGQPNEQRDQVVAAVLELETRNRIPAANETSEVSNTVGWSQTAADAILQRVTRFTDSGVGVGVAGVPGLVSGNVVWTNGVATIAAGLPGERKVPRFDLAPATNNAAMVSDLFIVMSGVDGSPTPASGALIRVRQFGLFTGITNLGPAPAIGDPIYASDTGTLVLTPGTISRELGTVVGVGAGTFDGMFDPAAGTVTGPAGGVLGYPGSFYPDPNGLAGIGPNFDAIPIKPPVGSPNLGIGIQPAASTAAAGANIAVQAQEGGAATAVADGGNGGSVALLGKQGGAPSATNMGGAGGIVYLAGANGQNGSATVVPSQGGGITLVGGASGTEGGAGTIGTSIGGGIGLFAGSGAATGGNIDLTSGAGQTVGPGSVIGADAGEIRLQGGTGGAGDMTRAGGAGGTLRLQGGDGGAAAAGAGNAGNVLILGGAAAAPAGAAGTASLFGGAGVGLVSTPTVGGTARVRGGAGGAGSGTASGANGGATQIVGGTGGASAGGGAADGGAGGSVSIIGGVAGALTGGSTGIGGAGGTIFLQASAGATPRGTGGAIEMIAGDAGAASATQIAGIAGAALLSGGIGGAGAPGNPASAGGTVSIGGGAGGLGTATSVSGDGGSVTITGGLSGVDGGAGNGDGGAVTILGGDPQDLLGGDGGDVLIRGGLAGDASATIASGEGGSVTLRGGNGGAGSAALTGNTGGGATVRSGKGGADNGAGGGDGGTTYLQSNDGAVGKSSGAVVINDTDDPAKTIPAGMNGGGVMIRTVPGGAANASYPGGSGGDVAIYTGQGGAAGTAFAAGYGGDLTVGLGAGGAASAAHAAGSAGIVQVTAGKGGTGGAGGAATAGGAITLTGGAGGDGNGAVAAAVGGALTLTGGAGGTPAAGAGAAGGAVTLNGGAATNNANGGLVGLVGGTAPGSGTGGGVAISGGIANSGNGGVVAIEGGLSASGTNGAVNVGTVYANAVNIGRSGKDVVCNGRNVGTPTTYAPLAATTIPVDGPTIFLNPAADRTMTASPTLQTSGITAGTVVTLVNEDSTFYVDLQDDSVGGSKLKLSTGNIFLYKYDTITFIFDGTYWVEVGRNIQPGKSYTPVAGTTIPVLCPVILLANAGAVDLGTANATIQTTGINAGTRVLFVQKGAGTTTFRRGGSTLLRLSNASHAVAQYGTLELVYDGTNWCEVALANNA